MSDKDTGIRTEVMRLYREGLSQADIARRMGRSPSRINKLVKLMVASEDQRRPAKQRIEDALEKMTIAAIDGAQLAAKQGNPSYAYEFLDRTGVLEKKREVKDTGPKIMLVVGNAHPPLSALPEAIRLSLPEVAHG